MEFTAAIDAAAYDRLFDDTVPLLETQNIDCARCQRTGADKLAAAIIQPEALLFDWQADVQMQQNRASLID